MFEAFAVISHMVFFIWYKCQHNVLRITTLDALELLYHLLIPSLQYSEILCEWMKTLFVSLFATATLSQLNLKMLFYTVFWLC